MGLSKDSSGKEYSKFANKRRIRSGKGRARSLRFHNARHVPLKCTEVRQGSLRCAKVPAAIPSETWVFQSSLGFCRVLYDSLRFYGSLWFPKACEWPRASTVQQGSLRFGDFQSSLRFSRFSVCKFP